MYSTNACMFEYVKGYIVITCYSEIMKNGIRITECVPQVKFKQIFDTRTIASLFLLRFQKRSCHAIPIVDNFIYV